MVPLPGLNIAVVYDFLAYLAVRSTSNLNYTAKSDKGTIGTRLAEPKRKSIKLVTAVP